MSRSPRHAGSHLRAFLCAAAALLLSGCGRVGVEVLPGSDLLPPSDGGSLLSPPCASSCLNAHGTAECIAEQCVTTCSNGYADCDGDPKNGCEADVTAAVTRCGGCTLTCENPHGELSCAAGLCAPSCAPGFGDCDQQAANGCEADLASTATCGGCGSACTNAHGTTSCTAGVCSPSCEAGYSDCDADARNGCEANIESDPSHCGSCARSCGTNGQICVAGQCEASPCPLGLAECDGDLTATCETPTDTTLDHCGFCGNACRASNGTAQCSASACVVASCGAGYGNCDGNPANGCETQLSASTAHCSACNTACSNGHGSTSCVASTCVPSCSTGFGDCDTNRPNGCETELNTTANCGGCGRTCPANGGTPVCNAGVCGTDCNMSGTYALKIQLAATWPDASRVRSGSGTFTFWLKLQGTQSGTTIPTTVTDCGRIVPPFDVEGANETVNFGYPDILFDETPPRMPTASTTASLSAGTPGSRYALPLTALLMGTSMSDPINASWPASASGLTRVDHDMDGKPGVTADYSNGGGFTQPRTSATLFGERADRPYTASRLVFSLDGTLNSCTRSTGAAIVKFIDTRIFGCRLEDGGDCDAGEADFLDRNCVNYSLGSATYTLVKIADGAACSAVKTAVP